MSTEDKDKIKVATIAGFSSVFGAAIAGFVALFVGLGKNRGSDFDLVTQNLWESVNRQASTIVAQQTEITNLQNQVAKMRVTFGEMTAAQQDLERENLRLEAQVDALQDAVGGLPAAVWSKDLDGVVLYCNDLYEELFLTPRGYTALDYVGRDDFSVWPDEIARQFRKHDAQVLLTGEIFYGVELVEEGDGERHPWIIVKHPRYRHGIKSGVGGFAIPMNRFPNAKVILEIMAQKSRSEQ